jgi:hypothetical protein
MAIQCTDKMKTVFWRIEYNCLPTTDKMKTVFWRIEYNCLPT